MVEVMAIPQSLFFALIPVAREASFRVNHGLFGFQNCERRSIRWPGRPSRRAQNEDVQRRSLRCHRATAQNNLKGASNNVPQRRRLLITLCQRESHSIVPLARTRRRPRKDGTPVIKMALQRGASRRAEHNTSQLSMNVR